MNRTIMRKVFIALTIMIFGSLVMTSCYKDPGPGTAEIRVVNTKGEVQKGVRVRLFCTETGCDVARIGRTNSSGEYTQEFDLPVVLRVRAVRYDTTITQTGLPPNQKEEISVDSLCGEGFIQIENDEVTSERVTILNCN